MAVERWEIPGSVDVDQLAGKMSRELQLGLEPPVRVWRLYYDSFDGRLWRAGCTLALERVAHQTRWRLQAREPSAAGGPQDPSAGPSAIPSMVSTAVPVAPERPGSAFGSATATARPARSASGAAVSRRLGSARPADPPGPFSIEWWTAPRNKQETWIRRLVAVRGLGAADLPPGALRDAVAAPLSDRVLLPLVEARSVERRLTRASRARESHEAVTLSRARLRDGAKRAVSVAGLAVEEGSRRALADERGRAPDLERLFARRAVVRCPSDELAWWLGRLDRPVIAARWRAREPLEPDQRADVAERTVLRGLCHVIVANLPGTVAELDAEFLHDLRVAIRRTRSVLGRMRQVLPARSRARFKRELRWFGQLSGPARDLDVYLQGLDALGGGFPAELRAGLGPIRRWLSARRAQHYARIRRALRSKRGQRLFADWEAFVERAPARRPVAAHARTPIVAVARHEIWRAWRQAMRQGRRIGETSTAAELHELRKTCKKLRYLLELFGRLVAPEVVERVIGLLKGVQRALGDVQDIEVQSALLAELAAGLSRAPAAPPAAWAALAAIVKQLDERRERARDAFGPAFELLADAALRSVVRSAFRRLPAA